jgi:integrase
MIQFVFKPRRRLGGKSVPSRLYSGRYRLEGMRRAVTVALHVSDKQAAEARLAKLIQQGEREHAGITPVRSLVTAAAKSLDDHLRDYVADLRALGRDGEYVYIVERHILKMAREIGWKAIADVSADSFTTWRAGIVKAPKTLNGYLDAISGLLNWLVGKMRIAANPLHTVKRVETRGRETRRRRAFSDQEMIRLLAVSTVWRVIYLVASCTGLRRGEIAQLRWGDFALEIEKPFVLARASTTKNRKEAKIPLRRELVELLLPIWAGQNEPSSLAFTKMPTMNQFRADLALAGIPYKDADGRVADFHAFRHTLGTNLGRTGAPFRVAMEAMRHSDAKLTNKTYTDASQLPLAEAFYALPAFIGPDAQIRTQNLGAEGPRVSQDVKGAKLGKPAEVSDPQTESPALSQTVTGLHDLKLVAGLGFEPRTFRL